MSWKKLSTTGRLPCVAIDNRCDFNHIKQALGKPEPVHPRYWGCLKALAREMPGSSCQGERKPLHKDRGRGQCEAAADALPSRHGAGLCATATGSTRGLGAASSQPRSSPYSKAVKSPWCPGVRHPLKHTVYIAANEAAMWFVFQNNISLYSAAEEMESLFLFNIHRVQSYINS